MAWLPCTVSRSRSVAGAGRLIPPLDQPPPATAPYCRQFDHNQPMSLPWHGHEVRNRAITHRNDPKPPTEQCQRPTYSSRRVAPTAPYVRNARASGQQATPPRGLPHPPNPPRRDRDLSPRRQTRPTQLRPRQRPTDRTTRHPRKPWPPAGPPVGG